MPISDISADRQWVRWQATAKEWLAVIIACAATIIAIISMFVNAIAIGVIWSQESRIDALETEVRIYSNRTIRLETYLKSKGVPTDDIYND